MGAGCQGRKDCLSPAQAVTLDKQAVTAHLAFDKTLTQPFFLMTDSVRSQLSCNLSAVVCLRFYSFCLLPWVGLSLTVTLPSCPGTCWVASHDWPGTLYVVQACHELTEVSLSLSPHPAMSGFKLIFDYLFVSV